MCLLQEDISNIVCERELQAVTTWFSISFVVGPHESLIGNFELYPLISITFVIRLMKA
jgi:hypothetical protein